MSAFVAGSQLLGLALHDGGVGEGVLDLLGPRVHEIGDGLEEELLQHEEEHEEVGDGDEEGDRKVEHDLTPLSLDARLPYLLNMSRRATTRP